MSIIEDNSSFVIFKKFKYKKLTKICKNRAKFLAKNFFLKKIDLITSLSEIKKSKDKID